MAVGLLSWIWSDWTSNILPFINLSTIELLFSHIQARKTHFQFCNSLKVRFRNLPFMKLCYGLCRSCIHEHAELYIFDFHWVLREIFGFEFWLSKLFVLDSFDIVRIWMNHAWIVIVLEKTNTMVYHFLISVIFVHVLEKYWRTWWTRSETLAK